MRRQPLAFQQFRHTHHRIGEGLGRNLVARMQNGFGSVTVEMRVAIHFDAGVDQVHNPDFGNACATVGGDFFLAVLIQSGVGNLD